MQKGAAVDQNGHNEAGAAAENISGENAFHGLDEINAEGGQRRNQPVKDTGGCGQNDLRNAITDDDLLPEGENGDAENQRHGQIAKTFAEAAVRRGFHDKDDRTPANAPDGQCGEQSDHGRAPIILPVARSITPTSTTSSAATLAATNRAAQIWMVWP